MSWYALLVLLLAWGLSVVREALGHTGLTLALVAWCALLLPLPALVGAALVTARRARQGRDAVRGSVVRPQ